MHRYLIKGLLPSEGVGMIWGPPASMKTFWVLDAAIHIVMGWSFHGRRTRKGQVVYCPFEGTWGVCNRLAAFCEGHDIAIVPPSFKVLADDLRFAKRPADGHRLLMDAISEADIQPSLIVLDTLNQSLVGSENSDEDVSFYLSAAREMQSKFNCLVLIVHHTGKTGGDLRGHSSMRGNADVLLSVTRSGERGTSTDMVSVRVDKMKDGIEGVTVHSWVRIADLGDDEDGDPITSCYLTPAPPPTGVPSGLKGHSQASKALAILERITDDDGECTVDKWKAACVDEKIAKGTRVAQLKAFRRACDELMDKGIVHFEGSKVVIGKMK
jgi:hypothetical protein